MKICHDQGCNDIRVVIASKSHHYLFYFSKIKNSRHWQPYKIVHRSFFAKTVFSMFAKFKQNL